MPHAFATVSHLLQGLRQKTFSAVELCTYFLNRIEKHDTVLNSFITVDRDNALASAKKADEARAKGSQAPLLGLPLAHKDIFCTQGLRTSCASRMLDNFIAPYDATVVKQCREAGTVLLGKTNLDEFAMGSTGEHSFYGPTINPWDKLCVAGGSSSGSAAAVAAGLVPVATGTDTGGSIREPASFCGITGLKPTYGRVSRYGMIAYASSLDQGGLFARTAEDLALLLEIIAGHDPKDSTSANCPVPTYADELSTPLKGLRIGLVSEHKVDQLDPALQTTFLQTQKTLEQLGAEFISLSLPQLVHAVPVYYIIAPAECSSNLSRFDGVRYGHRSENANTLFDLYANSRGEGFGFEVKKRILVGTYALSSGYYDAYYRKAQQLRLSIQQDFLRAFQSVDCILSPATPHTALPLGGKKNHSVSAYLEDIYTIPVNLAGLPAIAFPAGFSLHKPIGMQLIAPHFHESRLLSAVHQFQQHTDWHTRTPKAYEESHA